MSIVFMVLLLFLLKITNLKLCCILNTYILTLMLTVSVKLMTDNEIMTFFAFTQTSSDPENAVIRDHLDCGAPHLCE